MMDISSAARAVNGYGAAAKAVEPTDTASAMGRAAQDFHATLANAESAAMGAMTGTSSSEALVSSLTQARLAVDTAVAVRDKVVEAYQEILRMPV